MKRLILASALIAAPAMADWKAANPQVAEAAKRCKDRRRAQGRRRDRHRDRSGNKAGFVGAFADDAIVNSPFNTVTTKKVAEERYQSGALTYKYLHRSIEYAARRGADEVVLMARKPTNRPRAHRSPGKPCADALPTSGAFRTGAGS